MISLRLFVAVGTVLAACGCTGPLPLARALRPQEDRVYREILEKFGSNPKEAWLRYQAQQQKITYEEALARDETLTHKNPFSTTDRKAVSFGAAIYAEHCMKCHGEDADGDGWAARADHRPKNFRSLLTRAGVVFSGGVPGDWFEAVRDGKGPQVQYEEGPARAMPAYRDRLANEQIWLVLTYLASTE